MNKFKDGRLIDYNNPQIEQITYSIFEITKMLKMRNINIRKDFLKKYSWSYEKKCNLIESVLLNIPIRAIYAVEKKDYSWEIVDGQNRINSIYEFVENKYPIRNINTYNQPIYFDQLQGYVQRKIEDYSIMLFVIKNNNDPQIIDLIIKNINYGAIELNDEEIKRYVYKR